jgi:hypothetical protein
MTAPSYTEDLTDIATGDEGSGWVELTGTDGAGESYNAQGAPAYGDNEYPYIQGNYAVTQDTTKNTSVGSLAYSSGGITIPTDGAVFVWHNYSSPFAFGTYAQGGFRICIGSGLSDFNIWYVGGNDKDSYPYGGFVNHVVNPTVTADDTAGSPTGTLDYVGSAVYVVSGPGKGEPHQVDVMRYGRGSAIFEYGDGTNGYCTIPGFATQNDNQSYRWGLIQATPGGYLWKGRMQLGSASNPVDFRDSNRTIFIQWTPKVTANFNTIEVLNASSNVEMTDFTFKCLDPSGTASKGRWLTTNDATIVLTNCSFIDMATFVFDSNTTIAGCTFKRCGQVTQGAADIDGTIFDECTDAVALLVDNPDNVDDVTFNSDGTGHAIELTTDCAGNSYTLTDLWVSGYASSDGSTGNEVLYNNSGGAVTLNIDGGSGVSNISVRNGSGARTTLVANYSFTITGLELNTEVTIVTAGTSTELFHVENATTSDGGGKYQVTYSHSGGASVDVLIHHVDYQPDVNNIYGLTLPSANSSVKVNMFEDLNYDNPT